MPSTSHSARTYGRKSIKRKLEYTRESTTEGKRRRVEQDEVSTDLEEDEPTPPRSRNTRVAAHNLSQIFDQAVNTPSPSPSPTKSPTKLKERMLSRSRTETSIASGSGSKSSSLSSVLSRASSFPNPPASPGSKLHSSEAKQSPIPRPKPAGRTYAGPSRSFLVPIPVNPSTLEQLHEELDDEFAARESYTSIRRRWGVDDSEDDPYAYAPPTRTGSNASTPNVSPSKSGKGKGKARPEPPSLPNGMMNPLKSITELRNQGESRRFLDEIGYLWEGLDKSCAVGLRRASALEITTKLCDSEFARKAKAADFIGPTWDLLLSAGAGQDEDEFIDILSAFFAALVSRDASSLLDLAQRPSSSFLSTLFTILGKSTDLLTCVSDSSELRKLGLSKKDQNFLTTVRTAVSSSALFPPATPPSSALLVTQCLLALPSSSLSPTPENIKTLLASLQSHFSPLLETPLSTFITTSANGDSHVAFASLHNILSLLDTYLIAGWAPQLDDDAAENQRQLDDARDQWLLDGLVALAVYTEVLNTRRSTAAETNKIRQCALVSLRLLVSMSHSDKGWCAKLTKSEFCFGFVLRAILRGHFTRLGQTKEERGAKKEEDLGAVAKSGGRSNTKRPKIKKEEAFKAEELDAVNADGGIPDEGLDTLCLALGILTNLIQGDGEVKNTLRETYVSPQCTLAKLSCLTACKCAHQLTALEVIVKVYKELLPVEEAPGLKAESSPEPTDQPEDHSAVLAAAEVRLLLAHLSLLIGLLMLNNGANQTVLLALLPAPSTLESRYSGDAAKIDVLIGQAREFGYIYHDARAGTDTGESAAEMESVRTIVRFLEGLKEI